MRRSVITVTLTGILCFAGSTGAQEIHPKVGTTSVPSLNLGTGPVGVSLSEGMTAWSGSVEVVYWNPAAASHLASASGIDIALSSARLLGDAKQTSLHWGTAWRGMGVAMQISYSGITGIYVYGDLPTPEPLSTTSAYDIVAGVSFGLPVLGGGGVGLTWKGVYEKLHYSDAFGGAVDAGVQMPLPVLNEMITAGIAVRNIGRMGELEQERLELPWSVAVGLAMARPLEIGQWSFRAGGDVWKPVDDWTQLRIGMETAYSLLRLRLGTRRGKGWRTLSAGVGFVMGDWQLDYAYVYDPDTNRRILGSIQRLGISLSLGGERAGR